MPINQERMLFLLEEHEAHINAVAAFIQHVETALDRLTGDDLRDAIKGEIYAFRHVPTTYAIVERRWFNSHARRNARRKEYMEAKRRANGVMPRDSSEYQARAYEYGKRATMTQADKEYAEMMRGRSITEASLNVARRAACVSSELPPDIVRPAKQASTQQDDTQPPTPDDIENIPVLERTQAQLDEERERGTVEITSDLL